METFFDAKNHPKIRLTVGGAKQGNLPPLSQWSYADGRRSQESVFSIEVDLDGKREIVPARTG